MKKIIRIRTWLLFSFTAFFLLQSSPCAFAQEVFICVWRNPERTMTRLFPEAKDYKTVTVPITPDKLETIEKRLGAPILPGQREQFQYFEMLDANGNVIGYTQAMTQKGEFGAIEMVFGLSIEQRVTGLYIQRARERDRSFREETFLNSFSQTAISDADTLSDPNADKGTIATRAVTMAIKKELITFDELILKKKQPDAQP